MAHKIDLHLDCNHILVEPIEAAIFTPVEGEVRYCPWHKKDVKIANVGVAFWVEDELPTVVKKVKEKK